MGKTALAAVLVTLALASSATAAVPDETHLLIALLPNLPPVDLGANGFTAVGSFFGGGALFWMPTSGTGTIGGTYGNAMSRDGTTIVGRALDAQGLEHGAIWQGGDQWRLLGSFTSAAQPCDAFLSGAYGASDDGKVIVGLGRDGCTVAHAFRWEESTGMFDLGSTVPSQNSRANNVSGDGRVVVGWQEDPTGFWQGAKWVNGAQQLIRGPSSVVVGEARAANHDGSLIVGPGLQARPAQCLDLEGSGSTGSCSSTEGGR